MINLLSPEEKQHLLFEEKKKMVLILELLGFLFLVLLFLVLFSLKIYISGELKAQEIILDQQEREFESSEMKDFPETVKKANYMFDFLESFYQKRFDLLEVLSELYNLLPEGVYLDSFSYQEYTSEITISGFAKTRKRLMEFHRNLGEGPNFQDPYFPSSVWLESNDINFNSKFKLKDED